LIRTTKWRRVIGSALYSTNCICTRCRLLLHSTASTNLYVLRHRSDSQRLTSLHDAAVSSKYCSGGCIVKWKNWTNNIVQLSLLAILLLYFYSSKFIATLPTETKIAIYLGLPTKLRGSENNFFVQELAMNTEKRQILDTGFKQKSSFSGASFTMFDLSERKQSMSWFDQSEQWAKMNSRNSLSDSWK
jgi:hypothetical protein